MRRVIIAGGRDFADKALLDSKVTQLWLADKDQDWRINCGMATGADTLGWQWAIDHELLVKEFPANWNQFGKAAGHKRNLQMALDGDILIAFWDGLSSGTRDMIQTALYQGLEVHVYRYYPPPLPPPPTPKVGL